MMGGFAILVKNCIHENFLAMKKLGTGPKWAHKWTKGHIVMIFSGFSSVEL